MKAARIVLAAALFLAAAGAAWAGGCKGFGCSNQCPLAQEASQCRSYGTEGCPACDALANQLLKNLSKV